MQIQFTQPTFVGTRTYTKGDAADIADEQAKRLIESGHATPVRAEPTLEITVPTIQTIETPEPLPKRRGSK